jgi:hypothetical protein
MMGNGVDWIGLALDRGKWRGLVNAIMNLRVPYNIGKLSSSAQLDRVSQFISYPRNMPWSPIGLWDVKDPSLLDNRLTDGGKIVRPTHPPHFAPQKHYYFYVSGTQFC